MKSAVNYSAAIIRQARTVSFSSALPCAVCPPSTVRGIVSCPTCFLGVPNRGHRFRQAAAYPLSPVMASRSSHFASNTKKACGLIVHLVLVVCAQGNRCSASLYPLDMLGNDPSIRHDEPPASKPWKKKGRARFTQHAPCHLRRCICMVSAVYAYVGGNGKIWGISFRLCDPNNVVKSWNKWIQKKKIWAPHLNRELKFWLVDSTTSTQPAERLSSPSKRIDSNANICIILAYIYMHHIRICK